MIPEEATRAIRLRPLRPFAPVDMQGGRYLLLLWVLEVDLATTGLLQEAVYIDALSMN